MHILMSCLIAAAIALPGCALADTDLLCTGSFTGVVDVAGSTMQDRPIDAEIKIHLADTAGTVILPRQMLLPLWSKPEVPRPLKDVIYTDDTITAHVPQMLGYRMEFNIDRITGHISVTSRIVPAGEFTGICQKYDPATVTKQF